jgi:hypothetical protein
MSITLLYFLIWIVLQIAAIVWIAVTSWTNILIVIPVVIILISCITWFIDPDKLMAIDRRWIFLLVAVAIIIPILIPLNLPVEVTKEVLGVYDEIEKLPPGTKIIVGIDYEPASQPEMDPMVEAILMQCFKKELKVVGISWLIQGKGNGVRMFAEVARKFKKETGKDIIYGKDYAYMGYKPGYSAMIIKLGVDFKGTVREDSRGYNVYEMELLDDIEGLGDFEYMVEFHDDSMVDDWIVYGYERTGIRIGSACTAVMATGIYPNLEAGQLTGIVGGLKGASEYEKLMGYRGAATAGMDSQSVIHMLIIVFIIIGNIAYLIQENRKRRGVS